MPETSLLRYSDLMTSRITWMEVLAGAHSLDEEQETRKLLGLFRIVEIGAEIAERAVTLRRERRLRLRTPSYLQAPISAPVQLLRATRGTSVLIGLR
jgi:predicted nucleic acid-binding protein